MSVRKLFFVVLVVALMATACTANESSQTTTTITETTTTEANAGGESIGPVEPLTVEEFQAFVNEVGWTMIRRSPEDVTDLGLDLLMSEPVDDLTDMSASYHRETVAIAEQSLARLDTLDAAALDPDDAVTELVLRWYLQDIVDMAEYRLHDSPVNYITGPHANFPEFMADIHPVDSSDNAEAYVARLIAAGDQMSEVAENLRSANRQGLHPTQRGIDIAGWQVNNVVNGGIPHPLVSDFESRLASIAGISDAERRQLVTNASTAVAGSMADGYSELRSVIGSVETRPDDDPGVWQLPDGDAYYAAVLRHHLTLDTPPDEIHQIGLDHVTRLRAEITAALTAMGYDVEALGFADAVAAAVADGGSFTLGSEDNRNAVVAQTEAHIAAGADAFATMFNLFPAAALEVQRPRAGREGETGAWYRSPPAYGDRPGIYYLNLGGDSKPMQTWATTNYHEAIPGHHFQLALQRESTGLPLIQRSTVFTGYAEGWGLYAERLAFEAGLYDDDPQGNIGRLRMELLRASRIVVDTGIHHHQWTYDEALDYMLDLGFEEQQSRSEIDRYVVWPGQAPAYLIGMIEILRVRDMAMDQLGSSFDLAAFHDEILSHGSLPLTALEPIIEQFIEDKA